MDATRSQWGAARPGFLERSRARKKTRLEMPVLRLGHLMAFVNPEHRGQGLARRALDEIMVPQIEERARCAAQLGVMPLLGPAMRWSTCCAR